MQNAGQVKEIMEIFNGKSEKIDSISMHIGEVNERLMIAEENIDKLSQDLTLVSEKEEEDVRKLGEFTN